MEVVDAVVIRDDESAVCEGSVEVALDNGALGLKVGVDIPAAILDGGRLGFLPAMEEQEGGHLDVSGDPGAADDEAVDLCRCEFNSVAHRKDG